MQHICGFSSDHAISRNFNSVCDDCDHWGPYGGEEREEGAEKAKKTPRCEYTIGINLINERRIEQLLCGSIRPDTLALKYSPFTQLDETGY